MKYTAQIKADDKEDILLKCLEPEKKKRDRSTIDLKKSGDSLIIDIEAKDANALRASLNAITQLLSVHEKTRRIK